MRLAEALGIVIRRERVFRGWPQRKLGPPGVVSLHESGFRSPSLDSVEWYAELFDVSSTYLIAQAETVMRKGERE